MSNSPVKTQGMLNFERQMNEAFPERQLPDGWIGDENHRGETSSHNPDDTPGSKPEWNNDPDSIPEVRAVDIWKYLGPDVTMQELVDHLRTLPNLGSVIRYMIYADTMYHVSDGFQPTPYGGSNPHYDHLHITFAFTQNADNNSTFDYKLEDINMPSVDDILNANVAPTGKPRYSLKGAIYDGTMRDDAEANNLLPKVIEKLDEVIALLKAAK